MGASDAPLSAMVIKLLITPGCVGSVGRRNSKDTLNSVDISTLATNVPGRIWILAPKASVQLMRQSVTSMLGAAVGVVVGAAVGTMLGATVVVGDALGRVVGLAVGTTVGLTVGVLDGAVVTPGSTKLIKIPVIARAMTNTQTKKASYLLEIATFLMRPTLALYHPSAPEKLRSYTLPVVFTAVPTVSTNGEATAEEVMVIEFCEYATENVV